MDIAKCKYKIVIDSREKNIKHIIKEFNRGLMIQPSQHDKCKGIEGKRSKPIEYYEQDKGLKTGDFTIAVQTPDGKVINFQNEIVIERKASLSEICSNLVDSKSKDEEGLNRFERELKRAKEQNIKVILLIEVADGYSKSVQGIFRHDMASKMRPRSFISKLFALKARYGFELVFIDKQNSADYIFNELYYHAREYLKEVE